MKNLKKYDIIYIENEKGRKKMIDNFDTDIQCEELSDYLEYLASLDSNVYEDENGDVVQLEWTSDLHSEGQGFKSPHLHQMVI